MSAYLNLEFVLYFNLILKVLYNLKSLVICFLQSYDIKKIKISNRKFYTIMSYIASWGN